MFVWFHCSAQTDLNNSTRMQNTGVFNPATNNFDNYITTNKPSGIEQTIVDFDFNCDEDFWTVNNNGQIQQWSLDNGTVTGGDVILTGGGKGLAFCGNLGAETFYCVNYPLTGITYYDESNGWVTIPMDYSFTNNGGYGNDQYYTGLVYDEDLGYSVNKILYYFDGTSLEIIETLETEHFRVADIAVDGLGRAWLFKGEGASSATSLQVYDSTGPITSFHISFESNHTYGLFFLDDTLYIGMGENSVNPNSITPVIINGQYAELGTPISFPNNDFFDMASCQNSNPLSINNFEVGKNEFVIFPNPTYNYAYIRGHIDVISVEVINLNGQLIETIANSNIINLINQPNGIYILRITTKKDTVYKKIIKE